MMSKNTIVAYPPVKDVLPLIKEHLSAFDLPYSEERMISLFDYYTTNGLVLGAYDDKGTIIGYFVGYIDDHPMFLEKIGMEVAFFSRRNGRDLIKYFEEWAIDKGATRLFVNDHGHRDLGKYYARLGYSIIERAYQKVIK